MNSLNILPVIVASVAAFAVGALWYSPIIFGKEWMSLNALSEADLTAATARGLWRSYLAQFIASLVTFCVLGFLAASSSVATGAEGAFLGLIIWVGFTATEAVGTILWEKKPIKLALINSMGTLVTFLIGGAIIGGWH